jgi:SAM-dependent methyltransferase
MEAKKHWEQVYSTKATDAVSWFQPHAATSLRLITDFGVPANAPIIDVGGGASTLVDDLLDNGYGDVTVLDLSATALAAARARLGERAGRVRWREGDICIANLPEHGFQVWHDRAVFHFLTAPEQREAYVRQVFHAVRPGGLVIVATFAEDGPDRCSGLPVMRYGPAELHSQFGETFRLLGHEREVHRTPAGGEQKFIYCYCRREPRPR